MIRALAITFLMSLVGATAAFAQQPTTDVDPAPAHFDVAAGYTYSGANAPPGTCDCFNMNGGFIAGDVNLSSWFSLAGEFTGGHASKISSLGQNLTLTTFTVGPKISWVHLRYTPYVEFLLGGAHGSDSYFPTAIGGTSSASSFAYSTGGGLDLNLTDRISLRAVDAQFLHTSFPNGANDVQRHLQIGAGLVFHFGSSGSKVAQLPPPPPPPSPEVQFSCSPTSAVASAGDAVEIVGQSMTLPRSLPLVYSWTTTAGVVKGTGRMITIDTTNLAPGEYRVDGQAALKSKPSVSASCEASFEVKAAAAEENNVAPAAPLAAAPPAEASSKEERDFRAHVRDAFFDYNVSSLRPDAKQAVAQDAAYLIEHPDIKITIAGYADERGSDEYNITLGLERATTTRDALAAAGVEISRIQVLSYGKEKPFCAEDTDSCYQLNRRAQILLDEGDK